VFSGLPGKLVIPSVLASVSTKPRDEAPTSVRRRACRIGTTNGARIAVPVAGVVASAGWAYPTKITQLKLEQRQWMK
jgi:hypothetical protein